MKPTNGRLALGTAQLGMPYGVANISGQPNFSTARAIVQTAISGGIRRIDTAPTYGESERILGVLLSELDPGADIALYSKLPPQVDPTDPTAVRAVVAESVRRLGRPLDTLLLHEESALDHWKTGVRAALDAVLAAGLAKHLGVSVYHPERALQAVRLGGLDRLQLPSNALDRRFEKAGVFRIALQQGVEVSIRSVFLQGLLLCPWERIPERLSYARPVVRKFQEQAASLQLSFAAAALGYARWAWPEAVIIVGAEVPEQLTESIALHARALSESEASMLQQSLCETQENIINPSLWPTAQEAPLGR